MGPSLVSAPSSIDGEQQQAPGGPACSWWSAGFAGVPLQVREARRWACDLLPSCDRRGDVAEIVSELAANAVKHTGSGGPGCRFVVEVAWMPGLVRLVVGDQGSPDREPRVIEDADDDCGRGLLLVQGLSCHLGSVGGPLGRWVYADVDWPDDDAVPDRTGIVHDEATLPAMISGQFRGTTAWWAKSDRVWRAAPGVERAERLLEAPSPGALSGELAACYAAAQVCHAQPSRTPVPARDTPVFTPRPGATGR